MHDLTSIAGRALRAVPRDPAAVAPPVFIALFFFVVNIATLKELTGNHPGFSYTAFEMATAILLGVTGVSRAPSLVLDVQTQYLDRLLLTPVRRTAILLGHMAADVAVAATLTVPILILGVILGVRFEGGLLGALAFVLLASLWSLAFAGFGYAIALKTGNPAAVNSTFLLFFPFLFLTSSYVPRSQLSGWLDTVAGFNPVTYLLDAVAGAREQLAVDAAGPGAGRDRPGGRRQHDDVLRRAARQGHAQRKHQVGHVRGRIAPGSGHHPAEHVRTSRERVRRAPLPNPLARRQSCSRSPTVRSPRSAR